MIPPAWTKENIELAAKLWREGHSAAQIARRIGPEVSRNSVLGRMHRMGISRPGIPSVPKARRQPPRPPRPISSPKPTPVPNYAERQRLIAEAAATGERVGGFAPPRPVAVPPEASPVGLMALTDAVCKWPINDPADAGDLLFCGARVETRPYCPSHARARSRPAITATTFERALRRYLR